MIDKANKINILDVNIDALTNKDAKLMLEKLMSSKKHNIICTVNTEFIMKAQRDDEFRRIINHSSMSIADGIGVLWAARFNQMKVISTPVLDKIELIFKWFLSLLLIPFYPSFFKNPLPERLSGADFVWTIAEFANQNKYRIFLLGGMPTVAERTALQLQTKIFGLKVVGVHSGGPSDTPEIIDAINKSKADILLVAFGAPKQEKWLSDNLSKTNCKIGVGVGGTFDFIAGIKKRAPKIMRQTGLEWLFRLVIEPRRIFRQVALPQFAILVLINALKRH